MTKNNFSCFADLVNQLEFTGGFENEWSHRWEYTEGTSNKYWELWHPEGDRDNVHVRWGRIGNNPQSLVKTWSEAVKKVPAKLRKGYTDEGGWVDVSSGLDRSDLSAPFDRIVRFGVAAGSNGNIRIAMDTHGSEILRMPKDAAEKFEREYLS